MEIRIYLLFYSIVCTYENLLINGGFQLPSIPSPSTLVGTATGWTGFQFQLVNFSTGMGSAQFVDLAASFNQNGYIQQQVTILSDSMCSLAYKQMAATTNYNSYVMQIIWNGVVKATKIGNITTPTQEFLSFCGYAGNNILKFNQIGIASDMNGMFIDQVVLLCTADPICTNPNTTTTTNATNITTTTNVTTSNTTVNTTTNTTVNITINTTNSTANNTNTNATNSTTITNTTSSNSTIPNTTSISNTTSTLIITSQQDIQPSYYISPNIIYKIVSTIFALPFNKMISIRYAYLFFEDLWLYYYADIQYEGAVLTVFQVDVQIQLMKNNFLDYVLGWEKYKSIIHISDHIPYTRKRFHQIEDASSVFIDCNFSIFVYTIPCNILIILVFFLLFHISSRFKLSKIFRKYFFFVQILTQALLEGNIIYFTYVCFSHLSNSWTVNFYDKAALIITVIIFFITCVFSLTFYFLVGRHKQRACYFIYNFYRCHQSYVYLTVKNLLRNLVRGAIFFYLHDHYTYKLLFLGITQLTVLMLALIIHIKEQIFISRISFCLELFYQLLFIFFNLSLYFEYLCEQIQIRDVENIVLQWERTLIILMISKIVLDMILDLVPLHRFRKIHIKKESFKKIKQKDSKKTCQILEIKKKVKKQIQQRKQLQQKQNEQRKKNIIKLIVKMKVNRTEKNLFPRFRMKKQNHL